MLYKTQKGSALYLCFLMYVYTLENTSEAGECIAFILTNREIIRPIYGIQKTFNRSIPEKKLANIFWMVFLRSFQKPKEYAN